jgi:type IV pilus assembly protein PilQ
MKKAHLLLIFAILMAPLASSAQSAREVPAKISFDFMDADVRNVLRVLAEVSKKNLVIADDVKGKITIKLENVSYADAFDVILRNADLEKVEEENIIRVMTAKKFFDEKDRSTKERAEFLREKQAQEKLSQEFVTETVYINYADVYDVERMVRGETSVVAIAPGQMPMPMAGAAPGAVPGQMQGAMPVPGQMPGQMQQGRMVPELERPKGLLSPNGVITVVKWNNALIIRDTAANVANIVRLIKEQDIPPQQIQIEARIVLATSTFSKELGVQWGANYNTRIRGEQVGATGGRNAGSAGATSADSSATTYTAQTGALGMRNGVVQFPYNVNLPANVSQGTGGNMGIYIGALNDSVQLDLIFSALESQAKGKIISNPKVITSDNRIARVTQGTEIPYQSSSAQLGTNIMFKLAVLELEVTPHVTKDGNIRLTIHAKDDQPDFNPAFPVPAVDKKEAVAELLVRNGQTVVMGGLYQTTLNTDVEGLPWLKDLPVVGALFRHTGKTDNKSELLIFITPVILKNVYAEQRDDL